MVVHPSTPLTLHAILFLFLLGFLGNLSMPCFLLWSMVLLCCQMGMVQGNKVVQRLNYGVVFNSRAELQLSNEYWLHTFKLPLPALLQLPSIGTCHKDNSTCLMISHVLAQINTIRAETSIRLNESIHIKGGGKRSLLPFIGQFSRSLFGTATVDDVNILARHINVLTRKTMKIASSHGSHMSSSKSKTNKRTDNLVNGIKNNEMAINYIHGQIQTSVRDLQSNFEHIMNILSKSSIQTTSIISLMNSS